MKVASRAVAVVLLVAWAGPLVPLAAAQQPAAPASPMPVQVSTTPQTFQEEAKAPSQKRGIDGYDVGAVAATALGLPFKAGICAMGGAFSIIVFAASWGARPDASAGIINEACGGKAKWIVRGSDIRPGPPVSKAFEWEQHRYDWEK